jgi:hypothetical protein
VNRRRPFILLSLGALLIATIAVPALAGTGPTQPDDPAAARQEITQAFETWGALSNPEEIAANLDLVDDPRGVVEAARHAHQNWPEIVSVQESHVKNVRFVSPIDAVVTYDIAVPGASRERTGHAVLTVGKWKLIRVTVCGDFGLLGGNCEGGQPCFVRPVSRTFTIPEEKRSGFCGASPAPPEPPAPTRGTPRFTG